QPAELDRYGPVPAAMGRRIAADPTASTRRWSVDQTGRLLDQQPASATTEPAATTTPESATGPLTTGAGGTSTAGYQPTARITRHVIVRDQFCVHPGCRRTATHCDLDHRTPWPTRRHQRAQPATTLQAPS
ncbi:MAG: hypothetical protein ACRDWT_10220, partial [Jatrophihabitantaceae bacterium]